MALSLPRRRINYRYIIVMVGLVLLCAGSYLLYIVSAPELRIMTVDPSNNSTTEALKDKNPPLENRLYIPKIDVNVAYGTSAAALDTGAWWRQPQNGNPEDGGNFVLAGHRLTLASTAKQTNIQSPFYHLERLVVGDEISVDYEGVRYVYRVTEKRSVKPNAVEIESRTSSPILTLYTCTLAGASDGRDVVIAAPVSR